MQPRDRLAFALDVPTASDALRLVDTLRDSVGLFKTGLELFCAEGPALVRAVAERGGAVFLDLKLHDIPATVGRAVARVAAIDGVRYLTVHAGGGAAMLREAVRAAEGRLGILGVTVLTSLDDDAAREAGLAPPVAELAVRRATLAAAAGCAGVVASPAEAAAIRAALGAGPLIVTPGIRPPGSDAADQKRTATPEAAITAGADILVVGRPIRDAEDPAAAARRLLEAIQATLAARRSPS